MSTGLAINMWSGQLPFGNALVDANVNGVSNCLVFLARSANYQITDITLSNTDPAGSTIRARLAITPGGVATAANDARKMFTIYLGDGTTYPQIWTWSGAIPLPQNYGLIAMTEFGLADVGIFGGISGRAVD